ncbi:hypothetical protein [uncultured Serinicoccus sp.]|uniref:hypothetical protein n=1 Tax=uncultured Serinicoccus sp. TaxID=735514 RepID=UPI00260F873D|nr:hypothetical protein [uncultured Serinicoccus sp.]
MDAEQLRERVLELEHLRARSRRLRLSRERLQPRLDRDRALLAERTRLRDAHQGDVDRLDRQGPHRWIASLDGSLDERRQRELAEAQEAAERVEEIRARLATLALEADQLDGDIAALGDTETPYQEALADLVLAARAGTPRPGARGGPGRRPRRRSSPGPSGASRPSPGVPTSRCCSRRPGRWSPCCAGSAPGSPSSRPGWRPRR